MPVKGLEPSRLAAHDPKSCVYTISPHRHPCILTKQPIHLNGFRECRAIETAISIVAKFSQDTQCLIVCNSASDLV